METEELEKDLNDLKLTIQKKKKKEKKRKRQTARFI